MTADKDYSILKKNKQKQKKKEKKRKEKVVEKEKERKGTERVGGGEGGREPRVRRPSHNSVRRLLFRWPVFGLQFAFS